MAGLPGFKGDSLPVAPGKLHGMRVFDVDLFEGTLHGVSFDETWNGSENVASCHDEDNKNLSHSMKDCDHGYWSYFGVNSTYAEAHRAQALIEGYGEVVIGEKGFRAEKARVKAITLPNFTDVLSHMKKRAGIVKTSISDHLFCGIMSTISSALVLLMATNGFRTDMSSALIKVSVVTASVLLFLLLLILGLALINESIEIRKKYRALKHRIDELEQGELPVSWVSKQGEFVRRVQTRYPDAVLYSELKQMIQAHKEDIILHGALLST